MQLNLISAMTRNYVIGMNNDLPWELPDDWSRLLKMVADKDIVMGRKTFESNKSFLSNRKNYIFSTQDHLELPSNCIHVKDLVSFLREVEGELYVLGGGEIYNLLLPYCNRLHLTLIETELKGDAYFPRFSDDSWILESSIFHPKDDKHEHPFYFNSYIRRR